MVSTNLILCFAKTNFKLNKNSLLNQWGKVNVHNFCLPKYCCATWKEVRNNSSVAPTINYGVATS
jgi:hypothetical protein